MAKYKPYLFTFVAGVLFALGYPSVLAESLIVTPIVGMIILFHFILKANLFKEKVIHLLLFSFSFNYMGFYWIADTLQEFGELPYVLAALLSSLFTLIITPHLWVAIIFIHFIQKKNFSLITDTKLLGLKSFTFAVLFTCAENYVPQQFDVMLGQSWVAISQYLGFADIAGLPIYSFFCYIVVFESISYLNHKKINPLNLASVLIFIFINPLVVKTEIGKDPKELNVRVVQANISNFLKIDSEKGTYASVAEVINRYEQMSLKDHNFKNGIDLIIWPETAYPYAIVTDKDNIKQTQLPQTLMNVARGQDSEIFVGGYDQIKFEADNFFKSEYNTTFHINSSAQLVNTYHKQILIPFGETLPFGPLNEFLSKHIDNISFFSEGKKFTLFELETGHKLISTICYELLKPSYIRKYLNSINQRPHAMVNLTNDSWYGKTQEPAQHLFLAKWRAIEFRIPIIRSTNTGISSVIYADGTESRRTGIHQTENLDLTLNLGLNPPTIYQRFGFATILPLWITYLIFLLVLIKLKEDE